MDERWIRFKGKKYLLIGEKSGAIATKDDYETGELGYAHLGEDGLVRRYQEIIGTRDDIDFLDEVKDGEIEIKSSAFRNVMMGLDGGWLF